MDPIDRPSTETPFVQVPCPICRQPVSASAKFCPQCGNPISGHGSGGDKLRARRLNPLFLVLLSGLSVLVFVGGIVLYLTTRDTWERDNQKKITALLGEAERYNLAEDYDHSLAKYREALICVGNHQLKDMTLVKALSAVKDNISQLESKIQEQHDAQTRQEELQRQRRQEEEARQKEEAAQQAEQERQAHLRGIVVGDVMMQNQVQRGFPIFILFRTISVDEDLKKQSVGIGTVGKQWSATYNDIAMSRDVKANKENEYARQHIGSRLGDLSAQLGSFYSGEAKEFAQLAVEINTVSSSLDKKVNDKAIGEFFDLAELNILARAVDHVLDKGTVATQRVANLEKGYDSYLPSAYSAIVKSHDVFWTFACQRALVAQTTTNVNGRYQVGDLKPGKYYVYAMYEIDPSIVWEWFIPIEIKDDKPLQIDLHGHNIAHE